MTCSALTDQSGRDPAPERLPCYHRAMPEPATPATQPVGRPSKLTAEFIAAAHEIIDADDNALIYTDEELLFQINEKLTVEARIGKRTFERWKAGEVEDDVEGQEFRRLVARALQKQKRDVFTKMKEDEKGWQRWAWIIERKWSEWNLKKNIGIEKTVDGAAALAAALLGAEGDEPDDAVEVPAETPAEPKKGKAKDA